MPKFGIIATSGLYYSTVGELQGAHTFLYLKGAKNLWYASTVIEHAFCPSLQFMSSLEQTDTDSLNFTLKTISRGNVFAWVACYLRRGVMLRAKERRDKKIWLTCMLY